MPGQLVSWRTCPSVRPLPSGSHIFDLLSPGSRAAAGARSERLYDLTRAPAVDAPHRVRLTYSITRKLKGVVINDESGLEGHSPPQPTEVPIYHRSSLLFLELTGTSAPVSQ